MYFKSIFLLNILLDHFICYFRFWLIILCTLSNLIQRHFSFTVPKFNFHIYNTIR